MFYWELHFEEQQQTTVDFLLRLPILPPKHTPAAPEPAALARLVGALEGWFSTADTAQQCHDSAWIEFDRPWTDGAALRPPGVSVCLDPDIGKNRPRGSPRRRQSTAAVLDIFARFSQACGGTNDNLATLARLHEAIAASGGELRHLSSMSGRPGQPAKVYAALPRSTWHSFMVSLGWTGDTDAAFRLGELVCAESERINLDFEIRGTLTKRLGFEVFFDPSPALDPSRATALALARSLELISASQAAALARWPGSFKRVLGRESSPRRLHRWLDLKFVLSTTGIELKAYLGFRSQESMVSD